MAQRLGGGLVGQRVRLPVRDGARLQQGDEPKAAAEQAQDGIAQAPGDIDDLGCAVSPLGAVVRAGDGVAQCRQARCEGRVVASVPGPTHRLGCQLEPYALRDDHR